MKTNEEIVAGLGFDKEPYASDYPDMDAGSEYGELECFGDVVPQTVRWLWYPYIPRGKVTILQGDPGEGKTTLAIHLAAMLSRGEMYSREDIIQTDPNPPILLQSAEDGVGDTLKPRLMAAKANCDRIFRINDDRVPLTLTDNRLANMLRLKRPALAVLDPLQAFLGSGVDMHRANEIRPLLAGLAKLAEETDTAILLIGHMNKRAGDKSMYRGLGSIDIAAAARSVLVMAKDPKEEDRRILIQVKSSLAPTGAPLSFRIGENSALTLEGIFRGDPQSLLLADAALSSSTKVRQAERLLEEALQNGDVRSDHLLRMAKAQDISQSVLSKARRNLKLRCVQRPDGWYTTKQ